MMFRLIKVLNKRKELNLLGFFDLILKFKDNS